MGRPPQYDNDSLLDAAVALSAGAGPQAVTMAAVIAAVGAPSGSIYHRFPNRPALQAALWLRTLEGFQAGFLEAVATDSGQLAALGAAAHTIAWSRTHQEEARVLLYGAADFGYESWPEPERARLASRQVDVAAAIDSRRSDWACAEVPAANAWCWQPSTSLWPWCAVTSPRESRCRKGRRN